MIRASDLIGCAVRTEAGQKLGRVHDLRAHAAQDDWMLMGLVVGGGGILARLRGGGEELLKEGNVIPWEAITRLEDGLITVRNEMAPVR